MSPISLIWSVCSNTHSSRAPTIPLITATTAMLIESSSFSPAPRANRIASHTPNPIPTAVKNPCQVTSNPPASIKTGSIRILIAPTS